MKQVGVLFDLDGVLLDTESLYTDFWADIDKEFPTGINDFARKIKGNTLTKILTQYFPDKVLQQELIRRINEFEDNMPYRVFDGVGSFLDDLARHEIPAAIVTSSDDTKMSKVYSHLPGFKEHFAAIINGSMVKQSKPDPEGYLMGAKAIGRDIRDCYVFEDSLSGIEAGNRAGATVIALATTLSRDKLNGKAREILDDFTGFTVEKMLRVAR